MYNVNCVADSDVVPYRQNKMLNIFNFIITIPYTDNHNSDKRRGENTNVNSPCVEVLGTKIGH
jgi:hypothetical protein